MARVGLYPDAPKPPCVVGYEVAGRSTRWARASTARVGERVMAGTLFSGYAERVAAPPTTSCRCPTRSPSSRAPPSRSTTPPRGRACSATARSARRAGADPRGRRRRGDRRDADRQARRRRGLGHRLARQARGDPRLRRRPRRSTTRAAAGSADLPEVRRRHGRHRRASLPHQLQPAAPRRAARRLRRLLGHGGERRNLRQRRARRAAHAALQPHQADVASPRP